MPIPQIIRSYRATGNPRSLVIFTDEFEKIRWSKAILRAKSSQIQITHNNEEQFFLVINPLCPSCEQGEDVMVGFLEGQDFSQMEGFKPLIWEIAVSPCGGGAVLFVAELPFRFRFDMQSPDDRCGSMVYQVTEQGKLEKVLE